MFTCKKCQHELDPERVPRVNGICWDCHAQSDREYFKEAFLKSPSLTENAYVEFIEWYETENQVSYLPTRQDRIESDWQEMTGTRDRPWWERHIPEERRPGTFKPRPEDKRRPAPGLE